MAVASTQKSQIIKGAQKDSFRSSATSTIVEKHKYKTNTACRESRK